MRRQVYQTWRVRREACPEIDVAEGVGVQGTDAALVVVREEFGFIGRQIHRDRAIALAAFAGEAEIKGVLDLFALPAVADDFSLGHLPEEVGAAAG